jgi:hypothetical protein
VQTIDKIFKKNRQNFHFISSTRDNFRRSIDEIREVTGKENNTVEPQLLI